MKQIKANEIRKKNLQEIETLISEKRRDLLNRRFMKANDQLVNTASLKTIKKEIARILFIKAEKELR